MHVVWRYENQDGYGPYSIFDSELYDMAISHMDTEIWPTVYLPKFYCHYRFAFVNLESAHKWFDGWHEVLRKKGFDLVAYVVNGFVLDMKPDIAGQVVFNLREVQL